ncbi:MAG TPA: PAS domain-containing protein [Phototrophicaceae bacterium]|nr:PAS domain-containing protein [Phototrophicaceae bacterium]
MSTLLELEQRIAELEASQRCAEITAEITQKLSQATDDQSILDAVAELAEQYGVAMSTIGYITELDADGRPVILEGAAIRGGNGQPIPLRTLPVTTYRVAEHPGLQIIFASDEAFLIIENAAEAAAKDNTINMSAHINMGFKAEGQWTGAIGLYWKEPRTFPPELLNILAAIRPILGSVIARRRLLRDLERRVDERTADLREREAQLKEAQAIGGFGSFEVNLLTGKLNWSNQMYEILQLDPSQPIMSMESFNEMVHPDDRENFVQVMESAIRNTTPTVKAQYRLILADGQIRYMTTQARVTTDEMGRPVKFTGILQDMTDRRMAQIEREQLQQQVIEAQRQALQDLSTPIIPILDRIIVMPLIGAIDSGRATDITRTLLRGISNYRAKVVILDITGVPMVDTGIAAHLNHTVQAARLKGAQTLVTGISDSVAETIVDLGIDWGSTEILNTLQSGLVAALDRLGLRIERIH